MLINALLLICSIVTFKACNETPSPRKPATESNENTKKKATGEKGNSKEKEEKGSEEEKKEASEKESKEQKETESETEKEEEKKSDDGKIKKYVIVSDSLNFRDKPSMSGEILGSCFPDEWVEVVSIEGEWTKVRAAGSLEGYVASRYLAEAPKSTAMDQCNPI